MELSPNVTYSYASLFRDIFCSIEHRINKKKSSLSPREEANAFGIDPNFSSETFLCGIFLLEDTSEAINNFNAYGLDGPTKIKGNLGERYLRLYGILNAAYMQYVVCTEFYKIFKIPNVSVFREEAGKFKILKARNAGASHSVNYVLNGIKDYYKIAQVSVKGFGEKLSIIGEKDKEYQYNLKNDLDRFSEFIQTEFHNIIYVLIERLFDQNSKDYKRYMESLEIIGARRKGDIVFPRIDGGYITYTSDPSVLNKTDDE